MEESHYNAGENSAHKEGRPEWTQPSHWRLEKRLEVLCFLSQSQGPASVQYHLEVGMGHACRTAVPLQALCLANKQKLVRVWGAFWISWASLSAWFSLI